MISLEEFIKSTYHTRLYIIVPTMNRLKINKIKFIDGKGKYSIEKQNQYLTKLYDKQYE